MVFTSYGVLIMSGIANWLKQPSSVGGMSALVAIGAGLELHQIVFLQAISLAAGALAAILLPDHTAASGDAVAFVETFLRITRGDPTALPAIIHDGIKLASDVENPTPAQPPK